MNGLKYLGYSTLGSKDIGIGKSEFVAKIQFFKQELLVLKDLSFCHKL